MPWEGAPGETTKLWTIGSDFDCEHFADYVSVRYFHVFGIRQLYTLPGGLFNNFPGMYDFMINSAHAFHLTGAYTRGITYRGCEGRLIKCGCMPCCRALVSARKNGWVNW